ncbi:MAG: hypothetical protein JWN32_395 [Solirubrobacterales bacterium]|nr:hypothetical protein [Solirubrobacterales bacterium]
MASKVVRARLDGPSEAALGVLLSEGRNESEAVRTALVEAGVRRRRRAALRDEAARLAADPEDRAELVRLRDELDALMAPVPD